jgi:hypothetical protein
MAAALLPGLAVAQAPAQAGALAWPAITRE